MSDEERKQKEAAKRAKRDQFEKKAKEALLGAAGVVSLAMLINKLTK